MIKVDKSVSLKGLSNELQELEQERKKRVSSEEEILELNTSLGKAKIGLMANGTAFIISIGLMLKCTFSRDIPTASTNGIEIIINPDFFKKADHKQRVFLLAHEIFHVALMHNIRLGARDPKNWNKAADYVINIMLHDAGYKFIPGGLLDVKFRGMSTEEVYNELMKDPTQEDQVDVLGYDLDFSDSKSPKEFEVISNLIKDNVMKGIASSQTDPLSKKGDIPKEVSIYINKFINPILDWVQLLTRFVDSKTKNDYTWSRPNRRYLPEFYLPSQYSESLDHITIAIDTSGSVNNKMLMEMLSEIKGIYDTFTPNAMVIIDCDSRINNIHEVEDSNDIVNLKFTGGGGTSFIPPLEYCKANRTNVLLYFTDLYAESITKQHGYDFDIMWICYSTAEPQPYGETIYYKPKSG